MTNMECVERLALTSVSMPINNSAGWLELAARAERLRCPEVANDFLERAIEFEAEEQERADAREWLEMRV